MKILFIQLPLLDHGYRYLDSNTPYAGTTLQAFVKKNFEKIETLQLHFSIVNYASDEVIVKEIINLNTDIVAFSNFLWNSERHLDISKKIKNINSRIKIIFGGPECSEDSFLFYKKQNYVDLFFSGEGEWFFEKYLTKTDISKYQREINSNILITQPNNELVLAKDIVEPYSAGVLKPTGDGSLTIEISRGCPFKCNYCFYSKNGNKIRELSEDIIIDAIKNEKGLKDIYILSPTFNHTAMFKTLIRKLKNIKHDINLHAEIRCDNITKEMAKELYDAGFRSLEVGLQTLTKEAIDKSGRMGDSEKELLGIKILNSVGIEVKIGIIPGLIGDTKKGFSTTIRRLIKEGFEENIEFYPLMVLPGTKIRVDAKNNNLQYQNMPPYFLTESSEFSIDDIVRFKKRIESSSGFSDDYSVLPDFVYDEENSIGHKGVKFSVNTLADWSGVDARIDTALFSFYIDLKNERTFYEGLQALLKDKKAENTLFNIIIYSDSLFDNSSIIEIIEWFGLDNFYARFNLFSEYKFKSRLRFYQVVSSMECYKIIKKTVPIITPILSVSADTIKSHETKIKRELPALLVRSGGYFPLRDLLLDYYEGDFDLVEFESFYDKKEFYEELGIETISYNFSFSIKNYEN